MRKAFLAAIAVGVSATALAVDVGATAPTFSAKKQDGATFDLTSRKGKGWTVLYFYPKAGTPGCTKEACAFRDAIEVIRSRNAEVYGISTNTVEDQARFHKEHKLSFDLLADPDAKVVEAYGVKMPALKIAKRWTFLLDPDLKIRGLQKDVDPALDAQRVADELKRLQDAPRP